MKRLVICLIVILAALTLPACAYIQNIPKDYDSMSKIEKEIYQLEQSKNALLNAIQHGDLMLADFQSIKSNDNDETDFYAVYNKWCNLLAFDGARFDVGQTAYLIHHPPEEYPMFQQMTIFADDPKELTYDILIEKDFDKIDTERASIAIKAIYGIDITSQRLKEEILICEQELMHVAKDNQFERILYQENDILVKVVALEDLHGNKYVAISTRYIPTN